MDYLISAPRALASISSKEAGGRRRSGGAELSSDLVLSLLLLHPPHAASALHLLLCPPLLSEGWGALRGRSTLSNPTTNPPAFLQFKPSHRVQPLVLSPSPPREINRLLKSRAGRSGHERGHAKIEITALV